MTKGGLRNMWFQVHKWIGLILAVAIIPICVTGAALVWHDGLEKLLHPARFAITGEQAVLPPAAYADAAKAALAPGERILSLRFAEGEPVMVAAAQPPKPGKAGGRPVRTLLWMDPATAKVLDKAGSNEGLVRLMHNIHGSLMVPGVGRQIVGWIGVAMLISSISGLWLWWPTVGGWLRGLRWRRHRNFDTNLHHQAGFWIALPLFVLSLTGAWISFPAFFGALSGEAQRGGGMAARMAQMRARPLEAPAQSVESVVAAAQALASGRVTNIDWPTDQKPQWSVSIAASGQAPRKVTIKDEGGAAELGKAAKQRETTARLMRRIHDGTGMGLLWQVIIFLGGLLPALLAVTGIIMWWRTRRWRGDLAARKKRTLASV